jgi:hypothetical protein
MYMRPWRCWPTLSCRADYRRLTIGTQVSPADRPLPGEGGYVLGCRYLLRARGQARAALWSVIVGFWPA